MGKYKLIAATGCATGIAHTYMAQEALEQAAKKAGVTIKVETHGQTGVDDPLTQAEIDGASGVIVASDVDVDADRFIGKKLIKVPVAQGIREPDKLVDRILNDANVPVYKSGSVKEKVQSDSNKGKNGDSLWNTIYVSLMNGVSHMLPFVVAGGVLVAISFFWGINSADPKSAEYNYFAYLLNTIGSSTMNLMVPVLCAFIAEAISKRSGMIVGFATGMIAFTNGTGFLGAIVGGYLAGYTIILLQHILKPLPDKLFRGLKAIFLYPVLGVLISGMIMWFISLPMKDLNVGMMNFLKGMENGSPILLGLIIGVMAASDFGGPINKAAYLTGTALLAQGNFYFMAGVSAACIAPPLATGFAVLFNPKAYSSNERSAGYVNFLLGSTHITEGAIPFAAKNPLLNIPSFMIGSSIAAILTYMTRIQVPAPHGGFIILPLVNHPFLWVLWIVIGALVSGALLAAIAGRQAKKHAVASDVGAIDVLTGERTEAEPEQSVQESAPTKENESFDPGEILTIDNIQLNVSATSRDEVLKYLADFAVQNNLADDADKVLTKYLKREQEGSTGMQDGIAIPHAQDATIHSSKMLVIKLAQPVEWQTFDDKPVDTIISFLIPANDSGAHLKYLSNTAKLLMHSDFIQELHQAKTKEEILNLIK
ncbi:phosphotransferase system fructose-specific component IIB [Pediococcus ethanolidurans]|uniref:PTS system, fructose-specific, IIB component/PTS system, fructose subfamily, IIA component/PTS system, fructose subfamily, IIC component n=1 Tax=Pediococcus ethanolidurans TaxID=319653 RepID=A0A0R2K1J9_9LACO|nr:fructose-specific PTS transporter subunit EIIC [Pediococcus ethanolidurans]KRN83474.1 phosphotransferase system fructose-specific component IIB [Pediococcus ethanolidurans]GEN94423.1 PTS fructose transporter subunit IIABC [Pediococcus ethanolidurans]SER25318.1 PTS system, fructose-specific, IIB component/PTS system, fructose subfamily, IIA component/PTS system, fructose subfamily, IIC component [Pediococcus ethanolidurans]